MCIVGNRKPTPLEALVITALAIGWQFNPTIHEEGQYHYIMVSDGGSEPRKLYLGKALEGRRFALGCDCNKGHCFYETLHNFTKREQYMCRFCSLANGMWEAADREPMPECEQAFMAMLQQAGVDWAVACRADLPYWHGRIDFYHMPSKTAMQVDGSSHFERAHQRTPYEQLQQDLKCCRAAWMKGGRLLRVHGDHGYMNTAALSAVALPYSRFVMVTRAYESITVTWSGISRSYADWLECVLPGAKRCVHPPSNCILYC